MKHPTHSPFSSKRVSQCDSSRAQRRDVRALLLLHQPHNAKPCCQIGFYGSDSTCLVVSGSVFLVRVKCVCPGWDHIQIKSSLWTVAHFWIKFSPGQHTHTHRYKCPPLKILRKHYPCTGDIAHVCVCVCLYDSLCLAPFGKLFEPPSFLPAMNTSTLRQSEWRLVQSSLFQAYPSLNWS